MQRYKLSVIITISFIILIFNSIQVRAEYNSLEILVKYKNDSMPFSLQRANNNISKLGVKKIKAIDQEDYEKLLNELNNNEAIEFVETNTMYRKQQAPKDPYYNSDWGLRYIDIDHAWDVTTGKELVIAVIDTGIDLDHPELVNQLVDGIDFVNNDLLPEDDDGHGTMVAEIIGAEANNNFGKAGVSWNVKLMPIKVLDLNGEGYVDDIANGIIYAADNGAKIINLSLGGEQSNTIDEAVKYAYGKGLLVVAAAGNTGGEVIYPAADDEVIAVGALDQDGTKASFSSIGNQLSITAPGVNIIGFDANGNELTGDGTSFSTPFVSGAAALVWSVNPSLSNHEVQSILESTAKDLGDLGKDQDFGFGALDIYKALQKTNNPSKTLLFGDFNADNVINIYDLVKIAKLMGKAALDINYCGMYDGNGDGEINLLDMQLFAENYGK